MLGRAVERHYKKSQKRMPHRAEPAAIRRLNPTTTHGNRNPINDANDNLVAVVGVTASFAGLGQSNEELFMG